MIPNIDISMINTLTILISVSNIIRNAATEANSPILQNDDPIIFINNSA